MSKAFTKEDGGEGADGDLPEGEEDLGLPAGARNYMTPSGSENLRAELKRLLYAERPELVKTITWAAGNGDRSENGDYIYGKRRLREIDRRIRFLTKRLESSEVVDPAAQAGVAAGRVLFGASVTVEDEQGARRRYQIVGIDEADVRAGRVSWISPIAKALLNARAGDTVILHTPRGDEELEILEVKYE